MHNPLSPLLSFDCHDVLRFPELDPFLSSTASFDPFPEMPEFNTPLNSNFYENDLWLDKSIMANYGLSLPNSPSSSTSSSSFSPVYGYSLDIMTDALYPSDLSMSFSAALGSEWHYSDYATNSPPLFPQFQEAPQFTVAAPVNVVDQGSMKREPSPSQFPSSPLPSVSIARSLRSRPPQFEARSLTPLSDCPSPSTQDSDSDDYRPSKRSRSTASSESGDSEDEDEYRPKKRRVSSSSPAPSSSSSAPRRPRSQVAPRSRSAPSSPAQRSTRSGRSKPKAAKASTAVNPSRTPTRCPHCGLQCSRPYDVERHWRTRICPKHPEHGQASFACQQCDYKTPRMDALRRHKLSLRH